jgi:hypothetical protein
MSGPHGGEVKKDAAHNPNLPPHRTMEEALKAIGEVKTAVTARDWHCGIQAVAVIGDYASQYAPDGAHMAEVAAAAHRQAHSGMTLEQLADLVDAAGKNLKAQNVAAIDWKVWLSIAQALLTKIIEQLLGS